MTKILITNSTASTLWFYRSEPISEDDIKVSLIGFLDPDCYQAFELSIDALVVSDKAIEQ